MSSDDGKLHRRQHTPGDGHVLVWDLGDPCAFPWLTAPDLSSQDTSLHFFGNQYPCVCEKGTVILAFLPNSLWDLLVESIWWNSLSSRWQFKL